AFPACADAAVGGTGTDKPDTASVLVPVDELFCCPTATQLLIVGHDTPAIWLEVPGLGDSATAQPVPSHVSINVCASTLPTATQPLAVAHDTPFSTLDVPGFALPLLVHVEPSQS